MSHHKSLVIAVVILYLFTVVAQAQPAGVKETKPADETTPELVHKLERVISTMRGLEFKTPVTVGIKTKDELKRKMIESYEKEEDKSGGIKVQKALVKLGLILPSLELDKFMIGLYAEQIGGYYDAETKELYLVPVAPADAANSDTEWTKRIFGVSWDRLAVVHEMTHALQDQYYDLLSLPMDEMDNDDLASAVKSLVEGEASFVMYDYLVRLGGLNLILIPGSAETPEVPPSLNQSLMEQAPAYIREGMLFPYTKGMEFIKHIKAEEGWAGIDKIYSDLPASTEQIIHPEKYLTERDYPIIIKLPNYEATTSATSALPDIKWERLLENVMGELNVKILMDQFIPTTKNDRIANGWDGDSFAVYEDKDSKKVILLWLSTWDSARDAREFFDGYRKLLGRKYEDITAAAQSDSRIVFSARLRQDYGGPARAAGTTPVTPTANAGKDIILLEQRDKDVLILEGITEKLLEPLAQSIWNAATKEELKFVKRIIPKRSDIPPGGTSAGEKVKEKDKTPDDSKK